MDNKILKNEFNNVLVFTGNTGSGDGVCAAV